MFTRQQASQVKPHVTILNPDGKTCAITVTEVVYYEKFGWLDHPELPPGTCKVNGPCKKEPRPNRDKKEKCPKESCGLEPLDFQEGNFLLVVRDFNGNKWSFYPEMKSNPKVLL